MVGTRYQGVDNSNYLPPEPGCSQIPMEPEAKEEEPAEPENSWQSEQKNRLSGIITRRRSAVGLMAADDADDGSPMKGEKTRPDDRIAKRTLGQCSGMARSSSNPSLRDARHGTSKPSKVYPLEHNDKPTRGERRGNVGPQSNLLQRQSSKNDLLRGNNNSSHHLRNRRRSRAPMDTNTMQRSSSNPSLMGSLNKARSTKNDLLKGNGSSHHARSLHRNRAPIDTNIMQRSSSNPNLTDNLKAHSTKNDLLKGNGSSHNSRSLHRRRASMDSNTMQRSSSNPNLMDNLKAHSTKNDLLKGNGSSHHSRNPQRRRASMDTNTMQRSSSNPNLMDGLKSRSSSRLRRASSNRKLMDQKQQQHNQQQQQEPSSKPTSRRSSMARPRSNPNLMKAATTNTTNKNGCPRRASSNGDLTLLKKKTDSNPNLLGHQRRVSSKTTATNPVKKDSKQPRRCHSRAQSFDESKDTGKILPNWRRRSKSSQEEDDESDESEHNNKRDPVAMYNRVRQRVTAAMREDRSIDDIDSSVDDIDMSAVSRDISWGDVSDSDIDLSVANLHMAKNAGCHGSSREFLTSNSLLNLGLQGDFLCRTKLDSEDKTDNPHTDSGRGRRQKAKQAKPQPMTKLDQVMAIQRNWKSASNQLAHVTL